MKVPEATGIEMVRWQWNPDQIFVEREKRTEKTGLERSPWRPDLLWRKRKSTVFWVVNLLLTRPLRKWEREGKKISTGDRQFGKLGQGSAIQFSSKNTDLWWDLFTMNCFPVAWRCKSAYFFGHGIDNGQKNNFDGCDRTHGNWRRTDIGVDYPFPQLPERMFADSHMPFWKSELQTQLGQEPPIWIRVGG